MRQGRYLFLHLNKFNELRQRFLRAHQNRSGGGAHGCVMRHAARKSFPRVTHNRKDRPKPTPTRHRRGDARDTNGGVSDFVSTQVFNLEFPNVGKGFFGIPKVPTNVRHTPRRFGVAAPRVFPRLVWTTAIRALERLGAVDGIRTAVASCRRI